MESLNIDVARKILNELDDQDLVNVCQTSSKLNRICKDQTFWLNRIVLKFPEVPVNVLRKNKNDSNKTWSEYYIKDLRKINKFNANEYLYEGSITGRLDYVIIALALGADYDIYEAMKAASIYGHLNVLEYLVPREKKPLEDVIDFSVIAASRYGHLNILEYLVSQGADANAIDGLSLIAAVSSGHLDIVKYLISQGADIHAGGNITAYIANERGYSEIRDYLVSMGVPLTLKD